MNSNLKLLIAICTITILYSLALSGYCLMKTHNDNNRWEVLEVTGEWANNDGNPLGKYLSEKWTERYPGPIPNKTQERCNKIANHYIDVVSNVRKVSVSKTIDAETYVIRFTSADGEAASLWLDENGGINSISEY